MHLRVFALIVKELLAVWKDKRSRFVLIGPPILQLMVFGYAATFDLNEVRLAVYNQDLGSSGRELVARFTGSPVFRRVADIHADREIGPLIDSRDVVAVLRIGPTFSRDLDQVVTATAQFLVDGRNSNTALILLNYANTVVADFNRDWLATHGAVGPPATLVVRSWFNPNLWSRWFIVPGIIALLTLVVTLVVTALSVARERELGTFDQLLVTPLRPVEIMLGKALPALLIGLVEGTFIILAAVFWFEVPLRGNLALLYAGLTLFLLSVVGVGLMISSFVRTQQQAILGAFLFLVPAIILSGFATPLANMPETLQHLTLVNPMRYFLVIVRGIFLQELPAAQVMQQLWPLCLIATASLSAATWLFRHQLQ